MPPRPGTALDALTQRFIATVDSLHQGLLILDPEYRLVLHNRRLAEYYPMPGDALTPGISLAELVLRASAGGNYPGRTPVEVLEFLIACFATKAAFDYIHTIAHGRVVQAHWTPLPDGSWLGSYQDITEQNRSVAQLEHLARHDALTDLLNRGAFVDALSRAVSGVRRGGGGFAVLAINLDRFRLVNESYGHEVGDAMLGEVARRLARSVREADVLARLANDEFAIIQAAGDRPQQSELLARRVLDVLGLPFLLNGEEIQIGASVGIALGDRAAEEAEVLLRNASLALYLARSETPHLAGRRAYRFFEPEMESRAKARRALEADLRQALGRGEFELYSQPLVNVSERRVSAFEALLRWRHPVRGMVPPDAFIPIAEEIGIIVPIGEWVLRAACAEAMGWEEELRVAVNLSAVQFASPGLAGMVQRALDDSGLPGRRLELEITETVLLQESDATLATLHQLRNLGARISMDDFGTGYSSLSYLRSFPFDKIKIDKSFISSLTFSDESDAIVRAIIGLGITLGIATAAEGVETVEQLNHLVGDGCTEVQGYFFSPPRPASEVPALIQAVRATQAA